MFLLLERDPAHPPVTDPRLAAQALRQRADLATELEWMDERFERNLQRRRIRRPESMQALQKPFGRQLNRIELFESHRRARQEQCTKRDDGKPVGRPPSRNRTLPQLVDQARSLARRDKIG